MKKSISDFIDAIGGIILSPILVFSLMFLFIGGFSFIPLIGVYKLVRENWKRGYMNDARREIILFLIVWGPFYFPFLYLIYNSWRK